MLERRDCTSGDLLGIAARKIQGRLAGIDAYRRAEKLGLYYSIGSEIPTQDMIQNLLSSGRKVCLPRVVNAELEFREVADSSSLEIGSFDIMEPKARCRQAGGLDVVLVPSVGVTAGGARLGYGRGFYDRFLKKNSPVTIAPVLEKQLVRNIPQSEHDVAVDWIVTEDRICKASRP